MKKKTVLLTFYDLGLGGIQTKIISLANTLAKKNVTTVVLLQSHVKNERVRLLDKNVAVIYTPSLFPNIFRSRYYFYILFCCYFYKASSLMVSLEDTSTFVLNWRKFLPFFRTKILVNYDLLPSAQQKLPTKLLSKILNRADVIVAVSQAVYEDLVNRIGVRKAKVSKIFNWYVKENNKQKKLIRNLKKCIFAGRLSDQKQPLEALHVFMGISKKIPQLTLEYYGTGEQEKMLNEQILFFKKSSSVSINKPIPTISQQLESANFLLLTSKYEGLPFIALEAMAHGCIIAAYNFPGVTEIITDGVTGVVAPDAKSLTNKITKLYEKSEKMSVMKKNAQYIQMKYFGQTNIDKFISLLL